MIVKTCKSASACLHANGPDLPVTEFSEVKKGTGKYVTHCRCCSRGAYHRNKILNPETEDHRRHRLERAAAYWQRTRVLQLERSKQRYNVRSALLKARAALPEAKIKKAQIYKQWREKHRSKLVQDCKRWYYANIEHVRLYKTKSYKENADRNRQTARRRYHKDVCKSRALRQQYRTDHRDQIIERYMAWLQRHPESAREQSKRLKWTEAVHSRYSYQCIICMSKHDLHGHHIVNLPRLPVHLKWDPIVGVSMCATCHRGFHSYYGQRRNNRRQLDAYIISELLRRSSAG